MRLVRELGHRSGHASKQTLGSQRTNLDDRFGLAAALGALALQGPRAPERGDRPYKGGWGCQVGFVRLPMAASSNGSPASWVLELLVSA